MTRRQESTDVLVIGSGPGGATTAVVASEAGLAVTIVEEGDWVEHGSVAQFSLDQMDRQYRSAGLTATFGRPPVAYAEGRCAGGGSEINSGLYHRPPSEVVEAWARDFSVLDLTVAALEPHADTVERDLSVGVGAVPASAASLALDRGARALGWASSEVPRWYRPDDGERPGRQTMTRTYLPRALAAGAQLRTGWRVERLLLDGRRVRGARCSQVVDGQRHELDVEARTTVVCAGAVHTPALLQRSGLRAGVGRTLQLHPTVKLAARFADVVADDDVPVHQVKEFAPDLSFGGSSSSPGQLALTLADDWGARANEMETWERMAVYYAAIRPEGRGRVVAVPGVADPLVSFRLTRTDLERLRRGLARLAHLLLAAGAERVWPSVRGAPPAGTAAEIPGMVAPLGAATASLMTVHLCSSVPMGERPDLPVDSFGRVKAWANCCVNDASLLPTAPGVNPQGSIMAIAHRNVARWLDEGTLHG
jgi:choline dehydrogenase-like flavoprotein